MEEQSKLFETAYKIAYEAHKGQVDKGGRPYIEHPLHVAEGVVTLEEKVTAILHDVLEDSDWTAQELKNAGIPNKIVEAVVLLTRDSAVYPDYMEYVREISHNPIARAVKMSDIRHNMDLSRIKNPTQRDYNRVERYKKAYEILEQVSQSE